MNHHHENCTCGHHNDPAASCGCEHTHNEDCGCDHDHAHDKHSGCGCGCEHTHNEHSGCGHDHAHDEHCGCGHDHAHDEHCGCGHEHDHVHGENCNCGQSHEYLSPGSSGLSEAQTDVLLAIHLRGYLPVARFVLHSSKNAHANSVALAPVYIADPKDDMETVKDNGRLFASLDEMGLITLDYDLPLKGYDYGEYHQSALYAYFQETVKEASQNPGFSMDVPHMDLGSMALTQEGHELLQALMAE